MNIFRYNQEKNIKLKQERGISFEEIILLIRDGHLIDIIDHPNQDKYSCRSPRYLTPPFTKTFDPLG